MDLILYQLFQANRLVSGHGQLFTTHNAQTTSDRHPEPPGAAAVGHEDVKIIPSPTPRDVLALVQAVMSESLVRAVGAVYEFNLSGENGGLFYLDLKNGKNLF